MGTRSHLITMKPIIEELLRRNHSVTSIFFQSIDVSHENYTEILLPPQPTSVFAMAAQKKMIENVSPASPGIQICKKRHSLENTNLVQLIWVIIRLILR